MSFNHDYIFAYFVSREFSSAHCFPSSMATDMIFFFFYMFCHNQIPIWLWHSQVLSIRVVVFLHINYLGNLKEHFVR